MPESITNCFLAGSALQWTKVANSGDEMAAVSVLPERGSGGAPRQEASLGHADRSDSTVSFGWENVHILTWKQTSGA